MQIGIIKTCELLLKSDTVNKKNQKRKKTQNCFYKDL